LVEGFEEWDHGDVRPVKGAPNTGGQSYRTSKKQIIKCEHRKVREKGEGEGSGSPLRHGERKRGM